MGFVFLIEVNFYIQKTIFFNVLKKDALSPRSIKRGNFITHNHLAVLQIIDTQKRRLLHKVSSDLKFKCVCVFIAGKGHLVY